MKLSLGGRDAAAAMRSPRRARVAAVGCAVLALTLAAGCSSSSNSPSANNTGASTQKVALSFWSWVPNLSKVVAIWNKSHPDIQVNVQEQAGGDQELTKLLTAAKGGNPPDLAQVEYQVLPTLVSSNYLANIAQYDSSLQGDYPAGVWNQVTLGTSALYGVPQDAAPMAFFYRSDLFKKYGLTVPTTWSQFLADATKLHSEAKGVYMNAFFSEDPGEFAGLTQEAGAQWWSASSSAWKVNIDSTESQQVASFWKQAVATGGVDSSPQWSTAWGKGMADGEYVAWVSDVWAPGDLEYYAPSDSGKWVMTALPQWTAGGTSDGNWGGSSTAVMAASKHQADAAEFASWLNTNPTATAALASDGGIYPADTDAESALASSPPSYFSNQPDFYTLAKQLSSEAAPVTWGPDVDVAYSDFTTAFTAAASGNGSFLTPLATVQSDVVNDMKKSGFTVSAG